MDQLQTLKKELASLRVAKVTGASANKMGKIKNVRKNIARVLTVANEKSRAAMKEAYKGKKYTPLDLRVKKTRAIRRRLTKHEKSQVVSRVAKRNQHFPQRKFAVKA